MMGCVVMEFKNKEKLVAMIAVVIVVAAFAALIKADRSHGGFGSSIDAGEVLTDVIKNTGHVTVPTLPSDLLIYGADQQIKLDLTVENQDQDNDIDTVFVTVPDGTVDNGTVSWKIPSLIHEWTFTTISGPEARFQAEDDLPGRIFGNSSQYDVSGNIDDALDYSLEPLVSEGITITLDITTPSIQGVKSGAKGISLEVADMLTEEPGSPRTLVEPFPYPFVVLDEDYEFIIIELASDSASLEVLYGSSMLFTNSRASDFQTSMYGFKYETGGDQIAVLDMPVEGTVVKPLIRATANGTSETFTINMWKYNTLTIDESVPKAEWLELVTSEVSYTDQVPSSMATPLDIDLDGDMIFNKNDNDRDGDGLPNTEDTAPDDPSIANRNPSVTRTYADLTPITEGDPLVLHVDAIDPDTNDTLTFTWSLVSDPAWTMTGRRIVVTGLFPGTYTFRVTVTDGLGGTAQGSLSITVNEKKDVKEDNKWIVYAIIAVAVVLILLAVIFFVLKDKDSEEEPQELSPEAPPGEMGMDEAMVGSAEDGTAPPSMDEEQEFDDDKDLEDIAEVKTAEPVAPSKPAAPESDSQEVQDLEQLIDDMEKNEEEIGDACPECNSPLGTYDTECPKCGAQFEIALECPNCGAVVEETSGKCPSCGVAFQ